MSLNSLSECDRKQRLPLNVPPGGQSSDCQPASFTQVLLPRAMALLFNAHPQAHAVVTPMESPALEAALTEQRFDIGLTERREAPVACELHRLMEADEVAVLPAGHALLARDRLSPEHFEGQAFISLAPTDPYRQQIDAVFNRAGVQRRLLMDTSSALSACEMVRQGLGVTILKPITARSLQADDLHVRPLTVSIPFHLAAAMPQGEARTPCARHCSMHCAPPVPNCRRKKTRNGVPCGFFCWLPGQPEAQC